MKQIGVPCLASIAMVKRVSVVVPWDTALVMQLRRRLNLMQRSGKQYKQCTDFNTLLGGNDGR